MMYHRVVRIFHPVGQGAFYTEKHLTSEGVFNIVYDCGNRGCVNQARPATIKAFSNKEKIDILFISHFDSDHVSLISSLRPFPDRIDKVVLPLLTEDEKSFLSGYYRLTRNRDGMPDDRRQLSIIEDPQGFFSGTETKLVFVRPYNVEQRASDRMNSEQDSDSAINGGEINSGVNVGAKDSPWVFIPYNMGFTERAVLAKEKLSSWLVGEGATFDRLRNPGFVDKHAAKLNIIYQKIGRGSNENSMAVYSGPRRDRCMACLRYATSPSLFAGRCIPIASQRPGCLYTGDMELEKADLTHIYRDYLHHIGTVQIPHHGSDTKFDIAHLPVGGCICPVSYGLRNKFGHPNEGVLRDVRSSGGLPIAVTEDPDSCYAEVIESPRFVI